MAFIPFLGVCALVTAAGLSNLSTSLCVQFLGEHEGEYSGGFTDAYEPLRRRARCTLTRLDTGEREVVYVKD